MGYTLTRREGKGKWHVFFLTRDGKRFRRSTKHEEKRRAIFVADEWYRRLADPTYQAANETSLDDAGKRMKEALVQAGRSPETLKFYGVKLSQVARLVGKDTPLSRITAVVVDEYIAARKREGAKAYTVSKELTALRMLLKHARRRGEFDKELSQVMPIGFATGYVPRQRRLTVEQVHLLIGQLPINIARYVCFVCATTVRDAAVGRARAGHLTPDGIQVFDRKTKRSTRTVPINSITAPFVFGAFWWLEPGAMVAPGISSVRHAFDRATKALGLPHTSPNDLRRSVAHWLLEAGVPRDVAAAFMGHANTKMLDLVYGKLDAGELGAAIVRALGSSVDETWKNVANSVDPLDQVEPETAQISAYIVRGEGIEPPTRGFSVPTESHEFSANGAVSPSAVDETWNPSEISEAIRHQRLAAALRRGVVKALARDADGTHRELESAARLLAGGAA